MFDFFKLKGPKKQPEKIQYDVENISEFAYFKNPQTEFVENVSGDECVCCGKISKFIYKDADYVTGSEHATLCSECIANGKAAQKFKFEFNLLCCMEPCSNKAAKNEVQYQTPSVFSFHEFLWPSCCDDMCQYVGNLNDEWRDVSKIDAEMDPSIIAAIKQNETFAEIGRPIEELIEAANQNQVSVLIFRCLHCGKYRVIIELD